MAQPPATLARREGNELFRTAKNDPTIGLTLRRAKVQSAIVCYNNSIRHSASPQDLASGYKNLTFAHHLLLEFCDAFVELSTFKYHVHECLQSCAAALEYADAAFMSYKWRTVVASKAISVVTKFTAVLKDKVPELEKRCRLLSAFVYHIHNKRTHGCAEASALLKFELGRLNCNAAVSMASAGRHRQAAKFVADAERPLMEVAFACQKALYCDVIVTPEHCEQFELPDYPSLSREAALYATELHQHQQRLEALRWIQHGDELLRISIEDCAVLPMDLAWEATDSYHAAKVIASENADLENEARALCRLGNIYTSVFKMPQLGHTNAKKGVEIALSMRPMTFAQASWYQIANRIVLEHQERVRRQEEIRTGSDRQQYIDELVVELEEMKQKSGALDSLLANIYEKHPVKDRDGKPIALNTELAEKAQLRKALALYHPDKHTAQKIDSNGHPVPPEEFRKQRKWHVLCEEITKHLTQHHELLKAEEPTLTQPTV
eukprot:m.114614 g.114614  ORF g.114614 m.114614 type:complete len:493 (-) comp13544_c0_seq1:430-1908(-)